MKNRGYTLLEVLGVIVILALLSTIVFPSVINFIKKSSDEIDGYSIKLISNAADLYIKARKDSYIEYNDNKYIIEMQDLIDDGNLPDSIKKSDIENIEDKCIQVEYKGYKFNYELKDKGTCEQFMQFDSICTLASDSTQTDYNIGAKYQCNVDPNRDPYTFYVLSYLDDEENIIMDKTNAVSVNLIMDSNIRTGGEPVKESNPTVDKNGLVTWINRDDYELSGGKKWDEWKDNTFFGPITAMNYLEEATKNWTNANQIEISKFESCDDKNNCSYSPMSIIYNTYARMPYKNEVVRVSSDTYWLIDYLINDRDIEEISGVNGVYGYWTLSMYYLIPDYAWSVVYSGKINYIFVDSSMKMYGVRPVISLVI